MPIHYITYTMPDAERPEIERLHSVITDTKEDAVARFAVEFSGKEKPWNRPEVMEIHSYDDPSVNVWTVEFCHRGIRQTERVKAVSKEAAVSTVLANWEPVGFQLLSLTNDGPDRK